MLQNEQAYEEWLKKLNEVELDRLSRSRDPVSLRQFIAILSRQGLKQLHGPERQDERAKVIKKWVGRIKLGAHDVENIEHIYRAKKREQKDFDPDDKESYVRILLHADEEDDFEAFLLVWPPGHRTPVHDHGRDEHNLPVVGAVRVLAGHPQIINYRVAASNPETNFPEKLMRLPAQVADPYQKNVVPVPTAHQVVNLSEDSLVIGLHVYSGVIKDAHVFTPAVKDSLVADFVEGQSVLVQAVKMVPEYVETTFEELESAPTKAQVVALKAEVAGCIKSRDPEGALKALKRGVDINMLPEDLDSLLGEIRDARLLMAGPLLDEVLPVIVSWHRINDDQQAPDPETWFYDPFKDVYRKIIKDIFRRGRHGEEAFRKRTGENFEIINQQDLVGLMMEIASFEKLVDQWKEIVYLDSDMGIIAKEAESTEIFQEHMPSYALAVTRLGGLAVRSAFFKDREVLIGGVRKKVPYMQVHERLLPLDKRMIYMAKTRVNEAREVGIEKAVAPLVERTKRMIDAFVELQHSMWRRQTFDLDFVFDHYGFTPEGKLLLLNLKRLKTDIDPATVVIDASHRTNLAFLNNLGLEVAEYYKQKASEELSREKLIEIWNGPSDPFAQLGLPSVDRWKRNLQQVRELAMAIAAAKIIERDFRELKLMRSEFRSRLEAIIAGLKGHPVSHAVEVGLAVYSEKAGGWFWLRKVLTYWALERREMRRFDGRWFEGDELTYLHKMFRDLKQFKISMDDRELVFSVFIEGPSRVLELQAKTLSERLSDGLGGSSAVGQAA